MYRRRPENASSVVSRRIVSLSIAILLAGIGLVPASAAPVTTPSVLVGCWSRTIPNMTMGIPGLWHLSIKASGKLVAFNPALSTCGSYQDFSGNIKVSGRRLTIGPLPVCPGIGVYTWNVVGALLMLRAASDPCTLRVALLSGVWKKP